MAITATIKKWGNSRSLRIPKSVADQMGLELGSRVTLTPGRKGLLIQKKRQRRVYKLSSLLRHCTTANPHRQQITGSVGREIL